MEARTDDARSMAAPVGAAQCTAGMSALPRGVGVLSVSLPKARLRPTGADVGPRARTVPECLSSGPRQFKRDRRRASWCPQTPGGGAGWGVWRGGRLAGECRARPYAAADASRRASSTEITLRVAPPRWTSSTPRPIHTGGLSAGTNCVAFELRCFRRRSGRTESVAVWFAPLGQRRTTTNVLRIAGR